MCATRAPIPLRNRRLASHGPRYPSASDSSEPPGMRRSSAPPPPRSNKIPLVPPNLLQGSQSHRSKAHARICAEPPDFALGTHPTFPHLFTPKSDLCQRRIGGFLGLVGVRRQPIWNARRASRSPVPHGIRLWVADSWEKILDRCASLRPRVTKSVSRRRHVFLILQRRITKNALSRSPQDFRSCRRT